MKIQNIPVLKSDERGSIFDCGDYHLVMRKEGSISANHSHEDPERLYLIEGEAKLTVNDETKVVKAPVMIDIYTNEYHKIDAVTDVIFIYKRDFSKE